MVEFLYQGLVDWFQDQVEKGVLSAGDKMPSLRKLAKEQSLSLNTVIHGYELLAQEGWIEARVKSGYYVCHRSHLRSAVMAAAEITQELKQEQSLTLEQQHRFSKALHCNAFSLLGKELFTVQLSNMKASHPQGELSVRASLTTFLESLSIKTKSEQIWLASRATSLLAQSIQSLTKVGAKILVITPCDYRLTQTILELGRVPVTLTAGDHGADIDAVELALKDESVELLLLPSQFAFPMGQELTNLNLRRWYALIEAHNVPAIEWDMSSLFPNRPHNTMTLKSLDQAGNIIYLGGFEGVHDSTNLAWLITGRYKEQLAGVLKASDLCPGVDQQLALIPLLTYLKQKAFSMMSRAIWTNAEKVKYQLEQLGEGKLSVVVNKGGHSLWIHSDKAINESVWQDYQASRLNTLIPGQYLSCDSDANHWFALNLSLTDQLEATVTWLQQVVDEGKATTDGSQKTAESNLSGEKTSNSEPVYNPMLDLINHDFG